MVTTLLSPSLILMHVMVGHAERSEWNLFHALHLGRRLSAYLQLGSPNLSDQQRHGCHNLFYTRQRELCDTCKFDCHTNCTYFVLITCYTLRKKSSEVDGREGGRVGGGGWEGG